MTNKEFLKIRIEDFYCRRHPKPQKKISSKIYEVYKYPRFSSVAINITFLVTIQNNATLSGFFVKRRLSFESRKIKSILTYNSTIHSPVNNCSQLFSSISITLADAELKLVARRAKITRKLFIFNPKSELIKSNECLGFHKSTPDYKSWKFKKRF